MKIFSMSVTAKKSIRSTPSGNKLQEQGRQIAALNQQVSQLSTVVANLQKFIASADLTLGDYELTAGEILTLESRVKKSVTKARKEKKTKPFDGTLESLVAA
jgi:flagellar motor switch protein FliM